MNRVGGHFTSRGHGDTKVQLLSLAQGLGVSSRTANPSVSVPEAQVLHRSQVYEDQEIHRLTGQDILGEQNTQVQLL